jgi:hypothetical protein
MGYIPDILQTGKRIFRNPGPEQKGIGQKQGFIPFEAIPVKMEEVEPATSDPWVRVFQPQDKATTLTEGVNVSGHPLF